MIGYGKQDITQEDIDAVSAVLRSDFLTQGPIVPKFENAVAGKVRVKHAIAVNSATSALHIACVALKLGKGDILWTVPNTFVASANCARYCDADVDFVDIDPDTWNISISKLKEKLEQAKEANSLPKILVAVHFSGQPTDQETIWDLSKEYGFRIIEDSSHSIGASRRGEPVGSCRWSDITIFSFHPVKIITTCEGGMAMTNSDELAGCMMMLRSHGITRNPEKFRKAGDRDYVESWQHQPWYYEQQLLGFNYRMTDIQAALGLSQLNRLDDYIQKRNIIAERYKKAFMELPLQLPTIEEGNISAFHLFVIRLKGQGSNNNRDEVYKKLINKGIGTNVHYLPVHLHPYYIEQGFHRGQFVESETYSEEALTLPLYPAMTEQNIEEVIKAVCESISDKTAQ
jgi:UDP-4-amino-4,6-dideoxy-N-acetyl-beta-L-altrosamine transaminase